ncbi:hypothetical protein BC332_10948 [Capsicum chinense]|nr:hypothetical protein BC332_10948 [Capsicum chinense]
MRKYLVDALLSFTSNERKLIKDSIDFMGINHYGTLNDSIFVVPEGMEEIVDYMKKRYHNKPMFVTENGESSAPFTLLILRVYPKQPLYLYKCLWLLLSEAPVKTTRNIEFRPIHMAARLGFSSVLKCVIDFGCDLNSRTDKGDKSLIISARFKKKDCLKVLTRAGADFGLVNVAGESVGFIVASNRWKLGFQGAILEVI